MISISKVKEAQLILENTLKELREETSTRIRKNQPIEGVSLLRENVALVSFSQISANGLSPSTYLPSCQIEAIEKVTKNITTFNSFVKKLEEIKDKKIVKVGQETIRLNQKTIDSINSIIQELKS